MKKNIQHILLLSGLVTIFIAITLTYDWEYGLAAVFLTWAAIFHIAKKFFPDAKFTQGITRQHEHDTRPFEEIYNDNGIFEYIPAGFKVQLKEMLVEIEWKQVKTIIAYKIDCFAYDTICMDVFCDNDKSFCINEETKGWFQFVNHCKELFPAIKKDWDFQIILPAFETNLTLVYDKANRTLEEVMKLNYKN